MTSRIFLDANVAIYVGGRHHPLKDPSTTILRLAVERPGAFVTDAEVLQELLHRYIALRSWANGGRENFHYFAAVMQDRVEPIHAADVEAAGRLVDSYVGMSGRDLLHAAVMSRLGVRRIVSADSDFDRLPDLERLDPQRLDEWRETVPS